MIMRLFKGVFSEREQDTYQYTYSLIWDFFGILRQLQI